VRSRRGLYEVADHVATITLNRPAKLNAWTQVMDAEVRGVTAAAASDEAVRVILVTGAERGFCAGADLERMKASLASGGPTMQIYQQSPRPKLNWIRVARP
jgi:enoyl-CoA hydratase/carnithine racemase